MSGAPSSPSRSSDYIAGTWTIDPVHSYIGFVIRHLMVSKVRGQFEHVTGEIVTGERIEDSAVTATVDVASIHTNNAQRDEHLRSGDFFDAEHHPTITFASKRFHADGETLAVDGAFTLHGVTKDITLTGTPPVFGGPSPQGAILVGFSATGSITRSDFGLDFNLPMEGGGVMLGEQVQLVLEVEAALNG